MDSRVLLVLCLLCGLEVDSQTFPQLFFGMNKPISNHGYVDLGLMGGSYANSVWCRTDLDRTLCCQSSNQYQGQWYFPDGQLVHNESGDIDIYEADRPMRVDLRRGNSTTSPTGIYCCKIPTIAVHDVADTSVGESVYVGLYTSEGKING